MARGERFETVPRLLRRKAFAVTRDGRGQESSAAVVARTECDSGCREVWRRIEYVAAPRNRPMKPGLYDQPLTRELAQIVETLGEERSLVHDLDEHHAPLALTRLLQPRIARALASLEGEDRRDRQLALVNRVLEILRAEAPKAGVQDGDHVDPPPRQLLAILDTVEGPAKPRAPSRPSIPLSSSDLLVNGPHDLSLGPELRRELASADRVDILCSFLKWSGLRLVEEELREFCARRGGAALRVLTTAYMMATEPRALDALAEMGAQVRVSYDTEKTRLHAKAWLLHRESGFSTAFVGSSNLSAAAMLDGLEWNVRLSQIDNGAILEKFAATFEQYWQDSAFRVFDRQEFDEAVRRSRRADLAPLLIVDVQPRPHQEEILEDLAAERANGHTRNLVVAATGTGKTIVAALDYKRLRAELPRDRLLFVAHRREILQQSLSTFQVVLKDGAFGEILASGERPDKWTHVFGSVQSLHEAALDAIPPDYFDVVIVDEFHHAAAPTYERLLTRLKPRVLLGLTATPERADGRSVLHWFNDRIASELRLWKALDQQLLSPFQYFGIGGAPDVSGVRWSRGRYDSAALSNLYTADHMFALRVVQEVVKKVTDVSKMRALGFCVDIAHAEFMARQFNKAGITSAAVSGETGARERDECLRALRDGELRCLFSVDLFNEGIDLPDVDTVLFLRPTESATIFLQQLGRGLRRGEKKECLTVLDFIGSANRKFRFDMRYRAIVGGTRRGVEREIEAGFPALPSGCVIQLDKQAQSIVLENIRQQLGAGVQALVEDVRSVVAQHGPNVSLATFLDEAGVDLEDVYSNGRCWTSLRRAAGVSLPASGADDEQIERALSRMLHIDDSFRLDGIRQLVRAPSPPTANDRDPVQRWLFALLGYVRRPLSEMPSAWSALWASAALRGEIAELLDLLGDRVRRVTYPLEGALASIPLRVHASYTLDEIMSGIDERNSKGGIKRIQTGSFYCERLRSDLHFVTLEKSEKEYSPTTLYNDYAISPVRFHWETVGNCHADTDVGRRYLRTVRGGHDHGLAFVRERKKDPRGETMPYVFLGEVFYATHRGGRPMQMEWDLARPMPAAFFQATKIAAG
jgi:superfamily II DNA or RNA helicase